MITTLMAAAVMAKNASSYRDKQIGLAIKVEGIEVVGTYPGWRYVELIEWRWIDDSVKGVETAIRRIDSKLTERWRDDGLPKLVPA